MILNVLKTNFKKIKKSIMEYMIGQVTLFGGKFAPQGWLNCDGSVLSTKDYEPLYTIVGNQFGGDGTTTFALPKIADENGQRYIICNQGVFPQRY